MSDEDDDLSIERSFEKDTGHWSWHGAGSTHRSSNLEIGVTSYTEASEERYMLELAEKRRVKIKTRNSYILAFVVLLLLGGGAYGAYFYTQPGSNQSGESNRVEPVKSVVASSNSAGINQNRDDGERRGLEEELRQVEMADMARKHEAEIEAKEQTKLTEAEFAARELDQAQKQLMQLKASAKARIDLLNADLRQLEKEWAELAYREGRYYQFTGTVKDANNKELYLSRGINHLADGEAQLFNQAEGRVNKLIESSFKRIISLKSAVLVDNWAKGCAYPRDQSRCDILARNLDIVKTTGIFQEIEELKAKIAAK